MRVYVLVALLVASTCWAQEPAPVPAPASSPIQAQAPAVPQNQTITIPAGTRIPFSLTSAITRKSGRKGNSVRGLIGFPVTVGTQLAIPAGTYVEGVIDKVTHGSNGPGLQMHFTRLLYANGYSVPFDATTVQAELSTPQSSTLQASAFEGENGSSYALAAQQSPTLPTVTPPPSHIGLAVGLSVGLVVATVVSAVLLSRLHGGGDAILLDAGWQGEMALQSPLTVDAASVAAAVAPPSTQ